MIIEILELVGLLLAFDGVATEDRPPQHPYVEYIPGNTNLVISVPHDGRVEPPSIPMRRPGCRDSGGEGVGGGLAAECLYQESVSTTSPSAAPAWSVRSYSAPTLTPPSSPGRSTTRWWS